MVPCNNIDYMCYLTIEVDKNGRKKLMLILQIKLTFRLLVRSKKETISLPSTRLESGMEPSFHSSYIMRLATTAKALAATIDKLAADAIDGVISDDL